MVNCWSVTVEDEVGDVGEAELQADIGKQASSNMSRGQIHLLRFTKAQHTHSSSGFKEKQTLITTRAAAISQFID